MGSGLCGLKDYDDILKDGVKQTAAQIKATLLKFVGTGAVDLLAKNRYHKIVRYA